MSALLFLAILLGAIGWAYFKVKGHNQWFLAKMLRKHQNEYHDILNKHFAFYQSLPTKSKKIFVSRLNQFAHLTRFEAREMSEVSFEMRVLISAAAIQLTFGFRDVILDHFSRIIVYPKQFWSNAGQRYHKGEVNPRYGVIVLSWKDFVEGYAYNEGVNLGLHEMAHALQLENMIENNEFGFMSDEDIHVWHTLAAYEIEKIISPETSFFRAYGGVSQAEFFAVAVENFFERPRAFRDYNKPLYQTMCKLLKQDPVLLLS